MELYKEVERMHDHYAELRTEAAQYTLVQEVKKTQDTSDKRMLRRELGLALIRWGQWLSQPTVVSTRQVDCDY